MRYNRLAVVIVLSVAFALFVFPIIVSAVSQSVVSVEASNGVKVSSNDVVIDIGMTDVVYQIPKETLKEVPKEIPYVSENFVDMSLDAVPKVNTAPRIALPKISSTDELHAENTQRKNEFARSRSAIKLAPTERDLPGFVTIPTQDVLAKVSRGVVFPKGENLLGRLQNKSKESLFSNGSLPSLLRIDVSKNMLDPTSKVPLLIAYKPGTTSALHGSRYGSLLKTAVSLNDLGALPPSERAKIDFIAMDTPITTGIVQTDMLIQGPSVRQSSGTNGAVGVCIIDTGINYTQPAFASNYVGGIDFVNNDSDPMDDNGHGSLMASAVLGIAPGAQLYVAKALDANGAGYSSTAIQAIDWCMQQNVSVISMSFGGGYYDSWCDNVSVLAEKANEAAARGFFVVAASGNDGASIMASPACGSSVTSVAASTKQDEVWNFSNIDTVTDLLAPGVNVTLTSKTNQQVTLSGTSISAAVVAGSSALMFSATNDSASALETRFRSTGVLLNWSHPNGSVYSIPRIDLGLAYANTQNGFNLTQNGWQSNTSNDVRIQSFLCVHGNDPCTGGPGGPGDCGVEGCSSQKPCIYTCNTGTTDLCSYALGGSCLATCSNYCIQSLGACSNAPAGTSGGSTGTTGAYSCSGQTIQQSACDGSGGTTNTITTCGSGGSPTCASSCVSGSSSCGLGASGAVLDCSGAYSCSTQTIMRTLCNGAGSCTAQTTGTTCSGTCANSCNAGSSSCGSGAAGVLLDCSGAYSCSGQTILRTLCNGASSCTAQSTGTTCGSAGNPTCASYCSSGSSSCQVEPNGATTPTCSGGAACSGQQPTTNQCDGAGSCTAHNNGAACAGSCASSCNSGSCGSGASGAVLDCGGAYSCSGQTILRTLCNGASSCTAQSTGTTCGSGGNPTCGSYCSSGSSSCQVEPDGTTTPTCSGGAACSGQQPTTNKCNGAGSCTAHNNGAVCAGSCASYCNSGSCGSGASGAVLDCGGAYTCLGQALQRNLCNGASACTAQTQATCTGDCNSVCVTGTGTCVDSSAGTDPGNICSGAASCSGLNVLDNNNCGTGTSCGYISSTCSSPSQACSGGACYTNNNYTCSVNGDCLSGTCKDSVYRAAVTSKLCAADASYCIDTIPSTEASGTTVGDSTCRGSTTGGSVWLSTTGRYQIQNSTGGVIAVIDKYGSMGVRGTAAYSQGAFDSGWQVKDSGAVTKLSISSPSGNLKAAGTLTGRAAPAGTGFKVQNTSSAVNAIITTTGNVLLKGDLAYNLATLS